MLWPLSSLVPPRGDPLLPLPSKFLGPSDRRLPPRRFHLCHSVAQQPCTPLSVSPLLVASSGPNTSVVNVHLVLNEIPQRLHVQILFSIYCITTTDGEHWSNNSTLLFVQSIFPSRIYKRRRFASIANHV
jgi:hypothetical protein